jgi:hypothetical protein
MRIRIWLAASAGAALLALTGASSAAAATEFGDNCVADHTAEGSGVTLFESVGQGNPLPTAAPVAGVITQWKMTLTPEAIGVSIPQDLRVVRLNPGAKTMTVIGTGSASIVAGSNVIDTRISVQPGDRLAIFGGGELGTLLCDTGGENVIGGIEGDAGPPGSTVPYIEVPFDERVPVSAVIEPDADNDGFGDETQDKCPQSASTQAECPVIVLDSFALGKKNAIVVLVAASESGSVSVGGSAKLPKASRASSSAKTKLKTVKKKATAGKITRFTLKLPSKLKSALRDLPRGRSITVKLTATATNVAGQVSKDRSKLKLKG